MNLAAAVLILFISNFVTLIALLVAFFSREKAQRKLEDLQHFFREKEDFNAMVVHELRTPLSLISGSSDTILRHKDLKKEVETDLIASIKNSSNSMLEMVSAILDLAKMEAGRFSVTKANNDLNELLAESVNAFLPLADEKKLKLVYKAAHIPSVPMDPFRIRQVINNLLSNAIKYTDHGEVSVSTENREDSVVVSIKDEGRGITEEELQTLFTRYSRLSSAKGNVGTGLGLVVAKGIVEAHNGKIWVDSKPGDGSTFHFSLPLN